MSLVITQVSPSHLIVIITPPHWRSLFAAVDRNTARGRTAGALGYATQDEARNADALKADLGDGHFAEAQGPSPQ